MRACLALILTIVAGGMAAAQVPAALSAPFTIRCYEAGVLIITEPLRAMPQKANGLWRGERWSINPAENGLAIVIDPGGFGVCEVTENAKRS
ncbi:MAG: hypothetical protein U1F33_13140 [Alphaproteobacteria bacterium]